MKNYLFECTAVGSGCEGEQFLVGADTLEEAKEIAIDNFGSARYLGRMSEEQAEASGLDEY